MTTLNQCRAAAAIAGSLMAVPRLITYTEAAQIAADATGVAYNARTMGHPLDIVAEAAHAAGLPYLTLLVVKAGTTEPSAGAYGADGFLLDLRVEDIPAQQQRALAYAWGDDPRHFALAAPSTYTNLRGLSVRLAEERTPSRAGELRILAGELLPADVAQHFNGAQLVGIAHELAKLLVRAAAAAEDQRPQHGAGLRRRVEHALLEGLMAA